MAATIILADHTGRLGNKLVLFAHVIAAAEEYGCKVINLSILPACHYFEGLHLNPLGAYPKFYFPFDLRWLFRSLRNPIQKWILSRRGRPIINNRFLAILDMENQPVYRMDSQSFKEIAGKTRFVILWGFPFRAPDLIQKHAEKLQRFFQVRPTCAPKISKDLSDARLSRKKTIAIHIRQGDFRTWNHGTSFLAPDEMEKAIPPDLLNKNEQRQQVWVCSDEKIPINIFSQMETLGVPRKLGEDLFLLSNCDIIIAGMSSLPLFCSFVGGSIFIRVCPNTKKANYADPLKLLSSF